MHLNRLDYHPKQSAREGELGRTLGRPPKTAERGTGCFERLARVDDARYLPRRDADLGDLAVEAVEWVRRMRVEGRNWEVLPRPSVVELYPQMRNTEDAPWHGAKTRDRGGAAGSDAAAAHEPGRPRCRDREALGGWYVALRAVDGSPHRPGRGRPHRDDLGRRAHGRVGCHDRRLVCNAEARRLGVPMGDLPLMVGIGTYNGVDVRVMADVVRYLRGQSLAMAPDYEHLRSSLDDVAAMVE